MGRSSGSQTLPPPTFAFADLGFSAVRPLLAARDFEELGKTGLAVVHQVAPSATSTFGWRFAGWSGPSAWRRSPRDSGLRIVGRWEPPFERHEAPVMWRDRTQVEHGLWVPVGPRDAGLGGFELAQRDAFAASTISRLGSVRDAMGWSAMRLRERRRFEVEQRQIRATVEARTRFFAQMSHELRSPLNAILGYVELITEERHAMTIDEIIADLARVHASATHLLTIVNDILDLAKAEQGHIEAASTAVPLSDLLLNIDDLARPLMANRGNRWVMQCPAGVHVLGDARRLQQVLTNLVSNAAKFTDHGEVRLEVGRFGDDVTIAVADSGIGMSGEQLDRLFQPFEQVHRDSDRYGGTGLGLAIAAQYVHQMGGAIDVESRLGVGTRFVVTLPAAPSGPGALSPG